MDTFILGSFAVLEQYMAGGRWCSMVIKGTDFGVSDSLGLNLSLVVYQLCG